MMLEQLGHRELASRVETAFRSAQSGHAAPDLGGTATTMSFTDVVVARLG